MPQWQSLHSFNSPWRSSFTDHWRCRFKAIDDQPLQHSQILSLLAAFDAAKLDFIQTEHLYTFNSEPGFSMGQGA